MAILSTMMFAVFVALVFLVLWVVIIYNRLIKERTRVNEAWADIDVQLKRRHDLIPNLLNTVKGYAAHEKETLAKVTEARTRALAATTVKEKAEAENVLKDTLKSIFALAENYPDLKANQNFLELQRDLTDTEDKIQAARRFYNGVTRDYNAHIGTVPANIVAGIFRFTPREFFAIEEEAEKAVPEVKF